MLDGSDAFQYLLDGSVSHVTLVGSVENSYRMGSGKGEGGNSYRMDSFLIIDLRRFVISHVGNYLINGFRMLISFQRNGSKVISYNLSAL